MTPVGTRGRIRGGRYAGWDVVVQDDAADTGGYFVLLTNPAARGAAFDDWVPDRASLDAYFGTAGWQIDGDGP